MITITSACTSTCTVCCNTVIFLWSVFLFCRMESHSRISIVWIVGGEVCRWKTSWKPTLQYPSRWMMMVLMNQFRLSIFRRPDRRVACMMQQTTAALELVPLRWPTTEPYVRPPSLIRLTRRQAVSSVRCKKSLGPISKPAPTILLTK